MNLENLAALFGNPVDLKIKHLKAAADGPTVCLLTYLTSITDSDQMKKTIIEPFQAIMNFQSDVPQSYHTQLFINTLQPVSERLPVDKQRMLNRLQSGCVLIIFPDQTFVLSVEIPK